MLSKTDFKNDVSFKTKDNKLLILIEHQSTNNVNMALRQAIYYFRIIEKYLRKNDLVSALYSDVPVTIPLPEFIVLYNGRRKLKEDIYNISANFEELSEYIDIKCKVYDINYTSLSNDQIAGGGILIEYAYLMEKINEHSKSKSRLDAFKLAVEDCKNKGYLLEYIKREEFVIMAEHYVTQEEIGRFRYESGFRDGHEEGIEQGKEAGIEKIICDMLARGCTSEEISGLTGYDIEFIRKIQNKSN